LFDPVTTYFFKWPAWIYNSIIKLAPESFSKQKYYFIPHSISDLDMECEHTLYDLFTMPGTYLVSFLASPSINVGIYVLRIFDKFESGCFYFEYVVKTSAFLLGSRNSDDPICGQESALSKFFGLKTSFISSLESAWKDLF